MGRDDNGLSQYQTVVKVGDAWYSIEFVDGLAASEKICGDTNFILHRIRIEPKQRGIRNTIFHELIHALSDFGHMKLKERQIELLANTVRMLFIDNPHLIDLLLKGDEPYDSSRKQTKKD